MRCKCGANAVQKSVTKVVEMTSETRRVPHPITDRTQEHLAGRDAKASQKELIGAIIGFIARNGSELPWRMQEIRLGCNGIMGICRRGCIRARLEGRSQIDLVSRCSTLASLCHVPWFSNPWVPESEHCRKIR